MLQAARVNRACCPLCRTRWKTSSCWERKTFSKSNNKIFNFQIAFAKRVVSTLFFYYVHLITFVWLHLHGANMPTFLGIRKSEMAPLKSFVPNTKASGSLDTNPAKTGWCVMVASFPNHVQKGARSALVRIQDASSHSVLWSYVWWKTPYNCHQEQTGAYPL